MTEEEDSSVAGEEVPYPSEQSQGVESVMFEVGDAVVARTKTEGCDTCGSEPIGVAYPKDDDYVGAFREGVLLCEEHYDEDNHYDNDTEFGFKRFGENQ